MRVLQLIDSLNAGGAERVAVNYANALSKRVEGSFLCTTRKEGPLKELLDPEVGYLFLERKSTVDFKAAFKLRKFIKENDIRIVQAHGSSYFMAVLVKILLPQLVLIWHCHQGKTLRLGRLKKGFLHFCSRWFNAVFTVNEALLDWSRDYLKSGRSYFIKNFVAESLPKPEKQQVFAGKNGKRLICVANLRPDKNHGLLLDTFSLILKKEPEATLHLFGIDFKDGYSKIILNVIKIQFRGSVFYHGMHPDIQAILPTFDVGVLSSDAEGLPLALLEYGQAGLPTVVTDVGQCREVVNGYAAVVDKGDGKAIAEAVLNILKNPVPAKERAQELRAHIKDTFGEKAILDQVITIYEEALNDN